MNNRKKLNNKITIDENSKHPMLFLAIIFLFAFLSMGAFVLSSENSFWRVGSGLPFAILYTLLPGIIFFALNTFSFKKEYFFYGFVWNFNVWWLLAWLLPLFILSLQIALLHFFSPAKADFSLSYYMQSLAQNLSADEFEKFKKVFEAKGLSSVYTSIFAQAFLLGSTFYAAMAVVEEAGWRGFLQREWKAWGFFKSSCAVAVLQAIYLLPLVWIGFLFPEQKSLGAVATFVSVFLFSLVLSYLRYRSASIYVSSIARGFFLALWGIPMMFFSQGHALHKHLLGFYSAIAMLVLLLLLWVLAKFFSFFALPSLTILEDENSK